MPPSAPAAPAAPSAPAAPASFPSAPASAPKSAPTPSKPAPASSGESSDYFSEAFADLDALDHGKAPAPKKEAAKPVPPSKAGADDQESRTDGQSEQSDTSADNAEESSKEKESASGQKPGEQQPAKPVKARELREAYEGLKKTVKEKYEPALKELDQLRSKVKEIEERGPEQSQTQERLAAIAKRNEELEQHMRFIDYQKSKEYQEQYWQPYVKSWNNAVRELKGLTMTVEDPRTGESSTREVTEADIQYFASLEPSARRTEINRLFPEDKEEVKRHINEINRLYDSTQEALKKAKSDGEVQAKTVVEQRRAMQESRSKLWKDSNDSLAQRYPNWFAPAEDDTEGNQLLDRGRALADLAFAPRTLTPEQVELLPKSYAESIKSNQRFTPEQMVRLHAIVRNKASNHDRLARKLDQAQAKITELEKNLKQYEQSEPNGIPAGKSERPKAGNFLDDAYSELDALDK